MQRIIPISRPEKESIVEKKVDALSDIFLERRVASPTAMKRNPVNPPSERIDIAMLCHSPLKENSHGKRITRIA